MTITIGDTGAEAVHVGTPCPARCGYVFSQGFSKLWADGPGQPPPGDHSGLTVCTRCGAVLDVTAAGVRHVPPVEVMLLGGDAQKHLEIVREMATLSRHAMALS